jgi:FMN phosphatase YigB (HAD superfamily)
MTKTLYVTDFDDTLAQTDAIVYLVRGGKKTALTPAEYATFEEEPGDTFDFSEFEQLKNAKPIERFARLVKKAYQNPKIDKVAVLTARSHTKPISTFLQSIGIPGGVSIAALGDANPQRKANYIEKHIKAGYTRIAFVDDSIKNIDAVKQLGQQYPEAKILTHQAKEHPKQQEPKKSIKDFLKTKITNPDTGNEILLQTALRNKSHPAHQQAVSAVEKYARQHNITIK